MTKRYIIKKNNNKIFFIDKEQKYIDLNDYFEIEGYAVMSNEQVIELLNKQNDNI